MDKRALQYTPIPNKKYVLLDWNVIKYLKCPRNNKYVDIALK